jgi:hypothetical protein
MKRYAGKQAPGEARVSAAIWKMESKPIKEINCLGRLSCDSGQTRVPEPPHMMTGRIFTFSGSLAKISIFRPKFVLCRDTHAYSGEPAI